MRSPLGRLVRFLLAAICAAVVVTSCRPNETVEGQARDAKIKTQVKSKLAADVGSATITFEGVVSVNNALQVQAAPVPASTGMTTSSPAATPAPTL